MACKEYFLETSEVENYIKKIKNKDTKEQIKKEIKKIEKDPYIGETKSYGIAGCGAVKVNSQRLVILYQTDEDNCYIIIINVDQHDEVYKSILKNYTLIYKFSYP